MANDKRPVRSKRLQEKSEKSNKKTVSLVSKKKSNKYNVPKFILKENADDILTLYKGINIVKIVNKGQIDGFYKLSALRQFTEQVCLNRFRYFEIFDKNHTEDLRVTAIQWHPTNPRLYVIGGKGGSLHVYRSEDDKGIYTVWLSHPGIGPGGTVEAIRWNVRNPDVEVVTASVEGNICTYTVSDCAFYQRMLVAVMSPMREWFCAVDVHEDGKSVYGGDNMGHLAIHRRDSNVTDYRNDRGKLHDSKIKHLEFNPKNPNLMVTASLDKTVKLWDIRRLSGRKDVLQCLEQDKGISCATFSRTDGCRLLTTDMHSELRVYKGPSWALEHKICHPHRCFQHMTNIVASWHPTEDLFVIGRYPDSKVSADGEDVRSDDLYSATSGKIVHQLMDNTHLITSLSQFNATGDVLATTSGRNVWLRKSRMHFPSSN